LLQLFGEVLRQEALGHESEFPPASCHWWNAGVFGLNGKNQVEVYGLFCKNQIGFPYIKVN